MIQHWGVKSFNLISPIWLSSLIILWREREIIEGKSEQSSKQTALHSHTEVVVRGGHLSPVSQQAEPTLAGGYDFLYLWRCMMCRGRAGQRGRSFRGSTDPASLYNMSAQRMQAELPNIVASYVVWFPPDNNKWGNNRGVTLQTWLQLWGMWSEKSIRCRSFFECSDRKQNCAHLQLWSHFNNVQLLAKETNICLAGRELN